MFGEDEQHEPWPADAVRNSLSKVQAFGEGPYEVHVHPSEAHEIMAHGDILERYGAVVVPDESMEPGTISTARTA